VRLKADRTDLSITFEGAKPAVRLEGIEPTGARVNYLTGDYADWQLGLPVYGGVRYRELYPGIDLVYRTDGRQLRIQFLIAPGADPSLIGKRYAGVDSVRLAGGGGVRIRAGRHERANRCPLFRGHSQSPATEPWV
jgi:hypothetical protein